MHSALESKKLTPISTGSEYVPEAYVELPDDKGEELAQLVAALESDDDVQNVYTNLA